MINVHVVDEIIAHKCNDVAHESVWGSEILELNVSMNRGMDTIPNIVSREFVQVASAMYTTV